MPRTSLRDATDELASRDPVMARFVAAFGPAELKSRRGETDFFAELAESIVYQQLAGKAAAAIWTRVRALVDGHFTPDEVLALAEERLRGAGLSAAKATSIRDLAAKVADGTVGLEGLRRLSDDEIVARLSQVRGIGRWTAEMFLIFRLRRLDVWPVDDYGVRKGYMLAYGLKEIPKPKELHALGDRFRPYRTLVAWYCWRAVYPGLPQVT